MGDYTRYEFEVEYQETVAISCFTCHTKLHDGRPPCDLTEAIRWADEHEAAQHAAVNPDLGGGPMGLPMSPPERFGDS